MPAVGDVLADRYRIDDRIGGGGMGTVYRAHDLRLDRDVALKVLPPNLAGEPVLAERFEREARALAAIGHPNVVAIYDVEAGDRAAAIEPFFVMELCDGGSLADRFAAGPMPPDVLVPLVAGVADGLAALHARGIVHRDVKPHNVLLAGGRAKLADFGLARPTDMSGLPALTAAGTTVGTLAYLPPEALSGKVVGPAGDVYGLAALTYEGLTGTLPRPATSLAALVEARNRPIPAISEVAPELGPFFDEPVGRGLSNSPADRPGASAFASTLTEALGRRQAASARGVAPAPAPAPVPVESDATTRLTIPVAAVVASGAHPPIRAQAGDPPWARTGFRPALAALLLFILIVGGLVAFASIVKQPPGSAGGGPASAGQLPSISLASPSPTATPTPSPSPSPKGKGKGHGKPRRRHRPRGPRHGHR